LSLLGYYSLKNYGTPYLRRNKYNNLSFSDLVARFYRDKRLRQAVLHAIEDIELTIDTKISHILGEKYGAYGYANFFNWCQKYETNPYLYRIENGEKILGKYMDRSTIRVEQRNFLRRAKKKIEKSASPDMQKFKETHEEDDPAPIWLLVNELTLGESIHIIKLMSEENRKTVAHFFKTDIDSLMGWLECINLIRNICCHNGDLADIKLITVPAVPNQYKKYLLFSPNGGVFTNRLALPLCIILRLINNINEKYILTPLFAAVESLITPDVNAKYYGFRSNKKFKKLMSINNRKNKKAKEQSEINHIHQAY
ncbi:Abi family protein, partial [Limosilactobacillus reuteri]